MALRWTCACTLALLLFISCPFASKSQELHCSVDINFDQVSGANSTFEALRQSITEYLNNTEFTECQFAPGERIECKLLLVVKSYDNHNVSGELQVQSTRPVFDSAYSSTILNFKDNKIEFEYNEGDPLIFSATQVNSQLTGLLNYYAYLIIALDFDTFSLYGGQPYWDALKLITLQLQNSGYPGWNGYDESRNRGAIIDAFTQPATKGLREMMYNYHRLGLDMMAVAPDKGRLAINSALPALSHVHQIAPLSVALTLFKDAKLTELVNIYSGAPTGERTTAYEILKDIYPAENAMLEKIRLGEK